MKRLFKASAFLMAVLVVVCSLSITSFAAKTKTELETVEGEPVTVVVENNRTGAADEAKFVLYVGKEFAGRHFTLETDAGTAPHAYTVNKDGYIEFYFETGSSSKFELALLDNKEPTVNSEKLETVESDEKATSEVAKEADKTDEKEEKEDFGMKLAILVAILVLLGGVYFFMCKKNGYPLGFKKKKGSGSYNSQDF